MSRHLSRHNGVSCDACGKGGFSGKRYKCLVCYDFDLCTDCYEAGETGSGRHTTLHPMQCILTRVDTDLFYNGENHSLEQPQSLTCPLCGQLGFSESQLREHVTKQHSDSTTLQEVICPVCAAHPSGDPNHLTDDLPTHLTVEHRALREMELMHEPNAVQSRVRRLIGRRRAGLDRYLGTLSREASQPQDSVDPITELLSQLSGPGGGPGSSASGVGGGGAGGGGRRIISDVPPHIQQLLEQQDRQAFERGSPSRRPVYRKIIGIPSSEGLSTAYIVPGGAPFLSSQSAKVEAVELPHSVMVEGGRVARVERGKVVAPNKDKFLLANYSLPQLSEEEQETLEQQRADKSLFAQELLLSTLVYSDSSSDSSDREET